MSTAPYDALPQASTRHPRAVLAVVAGGLGVALLLAVPVGLLPAIVVGLVAVLLGRHVRRGVRDSAGRLHGAGLGTTAVVLGLIAMVLGTLGLAAVVLLGGPVHGEFHSTCTGVVNGRSTPCS